jgi:uncharacterized protein (DUF58 family)
MRVKLQSPLFPLIALFAFILQIIDPSRAWMIVLVVFGGAVVVSYVWGRAIARNLHFTRERHVGWMQIGGHIEERITLRNTAMLPAAWIILRDHSTLPGYKIDTALTLSPGEFKQWDSRGDCNQRGLFSLGDADLETGDPFGIFRFIVHDSQRTSVMILPSIVTLPPFAIAPAGFGGDGQRRANSIEVSHNAASVREYNPNDSLRLIHWPTTARQGQFFVRQFDSAPAGDWWILLDLNRAARLGEGLESTEEAAVTLAASLAQRGLNEQKRVGLLLNAAEPARLAPQTGEAQRWAIMQTLAVAESSAIRLAAFLERARNFIHQRASLLIITAETGTDWLASLQPLTARGLASTVFLLDPASFGAPTSARGTAEVLRQRGLTSHIVTREALKTPIHTGDEKWTWQRSAAGGFVPVRIPSNAAGVREKR